MLFKLLMGMRTRNSKHKTTAVHYDSLGRNREDTPPPDWWRLQDNKSTTKRPNRHNSDNNKSAGNRQAVISRSHDQPVSYPTGCRTDPANITWVSVRVLPRCRPDNKTCDQTSFFDISKSAILFTIGKWHLVAWSATNLNITCQITQYQGRR